MTTKIDSIRPYEKNPRKIEDAALDKLMQSIQRDPQFMRLRPIVVDADGVILGGNQRWKACKKLGMKELPDGWVVRADDLTDEQRKRFVLVDNAPDGMSGEWDFEVLKDEWGGDALADMGFEVPDVFVPDFQPGSEQEQGKLDELSPIPVKCPHCGEEFNAREQM